MPKTGFGSNYTRGNIIKDIVFMSKGGLSENAIHSILYSVSWAWTELNEDHGKIYRAKIKGCKYWTKEAFDATFIKIGGNYAVRKGFNIDKELRHEHVVPKSIFIETVMDDIKNGKLDIKKLEEQMEDNLLACIVTKEQDQKLDKYKKSMPNNSRDFHSIKNKWERYCEVAKSNRKDFSEIYEVQWDRKGNFWIDPKTKTIIKF